MSLIASALLTTGCVTTGALWDQKFYSPASAPVLEFSAQKQDLLVHYDETCQAGRDAFKARGTNQSDRLAFQPRAYWLFCSTNVAPPKSSRTTRRGEIFQPQFVATNDVLDGMIISLAKLDMTRKITTHADQNWLRHDPVENRSGNPGLAAAPLPVAPKLPHSIEAGTNALGQRLYITNALPEHGYYWKLSTSPLRYLTITNLPPEHGYYAASYGQYFFLWGEGKEIGAFNLPTYSTTAPSTFWKVALTPLTVTADVTIDGIICSAIILATVY